MRRNIIWATSTAAGLALLFSYRTSTMGPTGGLAAQTAAAAPVGVVAVSAADSAGGATPTAVSSSAGEPLSPPVTATASPHITKAAASPASTAAAPVTAVPASTGGTTSSAAPAPRPATLLVNGTLVQTRRGPVQVRVSIAGGRIVDVTALVVPHNSGTDAEINGYAVPRLRQEALAVQSATIDTVSGATYTSDGYRRSLQAALDAAHFAG